MAGDEMREFQRFQVESEERTDLDVIWGDQTAGTKAVRKPTRAERLSIILVGVTAIGFIVIMVVTLLAAVYISRR